MPSVQNHTIPEGGPLTLPTQVEGKTFFCWLSVHLLKKGSERNIGGDLDLWVRRIQSCEEVRHARITPSVQGYQFDDQTARI